MFYTGIGSQSTPGPILRVMEDAGFRLAKMGWVLRSGKAKGADAAFQVGCQKAKGRAEIYLPWKSFCGDPRLESHWDIPLYELDRINEGNLEMRREWMWEAHPAPDRLSETQAKFHLRNVHQLFGKDLADAYLAVSKFVIFWAEEDKSGRVKGGTATCVTLARKHGVRTLNLAKEGNLEVLEKFLSDMEERRNVKKS